MHAHAHTYAQIRYSRPALQHAAVIEARYFFVTYNFHHNHTFVFALQCTDDNLTRWEKKYPQWSGSDFVELRFVLARGQRLLVKCALPH